jgi:uroporphyrinogen-III decarboxylase
LQHEEWASSHEDTVGEKERDLNLDNLNTLIDEMAEIVASPENQANREKWKEVQPWPRDFWRGIPAFAAPETTPFLMVPMNEFWAALFQEDFLQYYQDPLTHLELQLRANIFLWKYLRDDRYFEPNVYVWMGVVTELSFFDLPIRYFTNREPWIDGPNKLAEKSTLERMEFPDFFRSGLMPRILEFYARMRDILGDRLRVVFPQWVRGPICHAMHLRGMQNLLLDMIDDPDFVHRLLRFVTNARKNWFAAWVRFTGEPMPKAMFYNDEIDVPTIAPEMYREYVLPYEMELAEFQGGAIYWHSCGNTTAIMSDIAKLPGLELMHVSPWASLSTAVSLFSHSTALDVDLDPIRDVYEADAPMMRKRIREIRHACRGHLISIRADGFQAMGNVKENLEKMQMWVKVARAETRKL